MMAGLIVNAMVATIEQMLEVPPGHPELEREVLRTGERQLRLIVLGAPNWSSA